jgi:hypothetical protein
MKALHLRYFPALVLLAFLAFGTAYAGTLTANGAAIKPHDSAQPNACANPPCDYTPTTTPPINNDPNSEAGIRAKADQAKQAKLNAQAHPTRKSRVPEGGTFYFLLIGAVVFFFARFLFKGKKSADR